MLELRLVLWAAWEPLGGTPPDECDGYAFRIASLLGSRAPLESVADELGRIRRERLGDHPSPDEDLRAAEKVLDWFYWSTRPT
jgi:hypothetical protein